MNKPKYQTGYRDQLSSFHKFGFLENSKTYFLNLCQVEYFEIDKKNLSITINLVSGKQLLFEKEEAIEVIQSFQKLGLEIESKNHLQYLLNDLYALQLSLVNTLEDE